MQSVLKIGRMLAVTSIVAAPQAHAQYTGLTIERHTTVTINSTMYDVFRLYANFTTGGDRLVAGFGGSPPQYTPVVLESRNANDTAAGNAFFVLPSLITAPTVAQISANPAAQWASFVTIGVPIAELAPEGDQIQLTPGFVGISGNVWTHNNQVWYVPPTIPDVGGVPPSQSLAGWTGDGDSLLRVMLLQVTVRAGENVRGVMNLGWFPPIGQGGGNIVVNEAFQSFNSFTIPTPGALAIFAICLVAHRKRTRACC